MRHNYNVLLFPRAGHSAQFGKQHGSAVTSASVVQPCYSRRKVHIQQQANLLLAAHQHGILQCRSQSTKARTHWWYGSQPDQMRAATVSQGEDAQLYL